MLLLKLGADALAEFLDGRQLGYLLLVLVNFLCRLKSLMDLIEQLLLVLCPFSVLQKLDLPQVPLVVVQPLDFVIRLDSVSPNEKVHEEGFVEGVLKLQRSCLVRAHLCPSKIEEPFLQDSRLGDICLHRHLDTAYNIRLDGHHGIYVLDHSLDPVAFYPRRLRSRLTLIAVPEGHVFFRHRLECFRDDLLEVAHVVKVAQLPTAEGTL